MARSHGRVLATIWDDPDFLALTEQQQRLYLFLISQPNLNHAGLLPLTLRRWSRKAHGLTSTDLERHLHALAQARFIVLDEDTEELLIRSFVRNDGVWKQPKVMGAMVSGAMEIESRRLRQALLEEMDRVPLDELSDEPTKYRGAEGPSIRQQVQQHIDSLRKTFAPFSPPPSGGGYEPPSGPPSDPPAEGGRKGSTRAGAGARDARVPQPLPLSPAPDPSPNPASRAGAREPDTTAGASREEAIHEQMLAAWWQKHGAGTAQGKRSVRYAIRDALDNGIDPNELWTALQRLGETGKPVTGGTLQFALSEIRRPQQAHGGNVVPISGGRPSTTDQRVADALELGRRMQADADAHAAQGDPA